jgi:hypothetical protein
MAAEPARDPHGRPLGRPGSDPSKAPPEPKQPLWKIALMFLLHPTVLVALGVMAVSYLVWRAW